MNYRYDGAEYSIRVTGAVIKASHPDQLWPTYMAAMLHHRQAFQEAERNRETLMIRAANNNDGGNHHGEPSHWCQECGITIAVSPAPKVCDPRAGGSSMPPYRGFKRSAQAS